MRKTVLATVVAPLVLAPALRADLLVVDGAGSGDFIEVQSAIDAAAGGDTILIRSGTYPGVSIQKPLTLIAAAGASVTLDGNGTPAVAVNAVGIGEWVLVRGLHLTVLADIFIEPQSPVLVEGVDGTIVFEDVTTSFHVGFFGGAGSSAASIADTESVAFVRCTLDGFEAQTGLHAVDSRIALYDSTVRGGEHPFPPFCLSPTYGGDAAVIDGGSVFASRSTFAGGDAFNCADGGSFGGHGLVLENGADGLSVSSSFEGGSGGGVVGGPGSPVLGPGLTVLPGQSGAVTIDSPVTEGGLAHFEFDGTAGELVYLGVSAGLQPGLVPGIPGVLLLAPPVVSVALGAIGLEPLEFDATLGPLPAGVSALTLHCQSAFVSPFGWANLGAPSALIEVAAQ